MVEFEIKEKEFKHISSLVYDSYGINLHVGKKELVRARLSKRLRTLGLTNFKEYIDYMERDSTKTEFTNMIDLLSTNLTNVFREEDHFKFLKKNFSKLDPVSLQEKNVSNCNDNNSNQDSLELLKSEQLKKQRSELSNINETYITEIYEWERGKPLYIPKDKLFDSDNKPVNLKNLFANCQKALFPPISLIHSDATASARALIGCNWSSGK